MYTFPAHIIFILTTLEHAGFEAFVVGGSVRDIIRGIEPKDWDITTNATPEQIQELFPDSVYENTFGTVGIKHRITEDITEIIEVTPYRTESEYTDHRHPKAVTFVQSLDQDLARRDFTINAMAMDVKGSITDLYGGRQDLQNGIIRTVGEPAERFQEDALRILRAVRFSTQLQFVVEDMTKKAMIQLAPTLEHIAWERIRDELTKIINTPQAIQGFFLMKELNLLPYTIPELQEGISVEQNGHHIYDVWEHLLRTMQHACDQNWSFDIRMAGLLHDIAKPRTKEGEGKSCTFYNHEVVGASMAYEILTRLRYPKDFCKRISKLVRYHMFYYDTNEVTESSVRKLVNKVGPENVKDLIKLRECDRIGSGTPKARPYRLRHFEYMTERVLQDPVNLSQLKIDGNILIKDLGIKPGPMIGAILNVLLADVIDYPEHNTIGYLKTRATVLSKEDIQDLKQQAILKIEEENRRQDDELKAKFFV